MGIYGFLYTQGELFSVLGAVPFLLYLELLVRVT
jgi:hypothetical protein